MSRPGIKVLQRTLAGMPAQAPIRSPLARSVMTRTVPACQTIPRLPTSTSRFSTRAALLNNPTPGKPQPDSQKDTSDAVEPPVFSLASLDLGKKARVFLIVVLCILGSIETWFWCQTIWRWWKSKQEDSSQNQDG